MSKKYRSLVAAAAAGDLEAVKTLLAGKAAINARGGPYGHTPLIAAIVENHTQVALYLIEQKADPNATDRERNPPLLWTMRTPHGQRKNIALAEALLAAGAAVDGADRDGMTPLMWAANGGSVLLVEWLLAHGANVHAKTTEKHNCKRTALMYAQGIAVVQVLLDAGADPKAVDENDMHTWEFHGHPARKLLKDRAGVK
jgi:ankyrin repeat protein